MRFIPILAAVFLATIIPAQAQTAMTVSIVQPHYSEVEQVIKANGYLEPKEIAVVNARLNGVTLESIHADLGDWVEAGQLLARFDDALIQNDITRAKAQLSQAQIALKQARDNAKRAKRLLKADAMSRIEGERFISGEQDAQASVATAQAQLDSSRLQLSYSEVKAPLSGIITDKQAVLGATANIGMPLFRIVKDGVLAWRASVSLDKLDAISIGRKATITLPNKQSIEGEVYNIAPTINQQSREATVYVRLARNNALRAGMLVSGEFHLGEQQQLLIPANTLQPSDGHNYVWLVDNDDTVHRQRISVGKRIGDQVEITEGLDTQSRIVARGGGFLNEGDKVHVVTTPEG